MPQPGSCWRVNTWGDTWAADTWEGSYVTPVADFSGAPPSGTAPLIVGFTDQSLNTPTSWLWEKNDGSGWVAFSGSPTAQNPFEAFSQGTWSVRLTAANPAGSDTKTKTDYISVGAGSSGGGRLPTTDAGKS